MAIDPSIGWGEDPYISQQTVPQISPDYGTWDTGSGAGSTPGSGSGFSWSKLADTLKPSPGDKSQQSQAARPAQGSPALPQSSVGRPSAPVNLNQLVQMLQQRQQMYAQGAMSGQAVQQPQHAGLLGF